MASDRYCIFCRVPVPPGPGLGQCDACAAEKDALMDGIVQRVRTLWRPPPKDEEVGEAVMDGSALATGRRGRRRRLLALMRRERSLSNRVARSQAAGITLAELSRPIGECWALRWALEELSRVFPYAAAQARADLEREEQRRRERRP